ncbi:DUF4238 domain-containing protein [Bradyrhizobium sp. HKCCYLRH3099]|uniref:DUF4238 domain-containing protein n=1 Tax=unclassified Bradyrhizobium TaxID=2631580 RepID=UPI003EB978A0
MKGPRTNFPRFNHYVPRFILENFAHKGQLSIFDKHTQKRFKLPPYRAMGEKDFTNVNITNRLVSFEDKFTSIEDKAAPVVSKLLREQSLSPLSATEAEMLHRLVIVQLLRSKRRRIDQMTVTANIRRRWPDIHTNPVKEKIDDEELEKLFSLDFTFSKLDDFTSTLLSKHCYLMIRDCAGDLYISDDPIVFHNSKQYGPYGNIGLLVPHIEIYFPLSPEIALAYMCRSSVEEIRREQTEAESKIGATFGRLFLSSTGITASDKLILERARAELERAKSYQSMILNERVAPMNSENLLFLNSLQIRSSVRYIACQNDNFAFAIKALAEKPHWKEGVGVSIA